MLLRRLLFRLHSYLGLVAGLVLAVMGVTGATMSFEEELLGALNRDLVTRATGDLPSSLDLVRRIQAQRPEAEITFLVVHENPQALSWVNLRSGDVRETQYVDRGSGRLLGEGRGRGFFESVKRLHRYLALPGDGAGPGRQITGLAALSLIFFALTGLYLRWPRRPSDWRVWLVIDFRRPGRPLYRMLHAVIGTWVLPLYLLSATTGLYWSYGWYREAAQVVLVGEPAPSRRPAGNVPPDLPAAWARFERELDGRGYETLTVAIRNGTIEFRGKLPGGRHNRVTDDLVVDAVSGERLRLAPYAERRLGEDLVIGVFELHRGAWFGLPGRIGITIAALTMPLFAITGLLLYLGRRKPRSRSPSAGATPKPSRLP